MLRMHYAWFVILQYCVTVLNNTLGTPTHTKECRECIPCDLVWYCAAYLYCQYTRILYILTVLKNTFVNEQLLPIHTYTIYECSERITRDLF